MFLGKEPTPSQKQHSSGHQQRERPRETWRRTIEGDLKKMGTTWKEVEKIAADRRGLVSALCAIGREEDM